jgi:hypothetical protein
MPEYIKKTKLRSEKSKKYLVQSIRYTSLLSQITESMLDLLKPVIKFSSVRINYCRYQGLRMKERKVVEVEDEEEELEEVVEEAVEVVEVAHLVVVVQEVVEVVEVDLQDEAEEDLEVVAVRKALVVVAVAVVVVEEVEEQDSVEEVDVEVDKLSHSLSIEKLFF